MVSLPDFIRYDKPVRTDASAVYPFRRSLERQYRFTTRFGDEVLLHNVTPDGQYIELPRALCPVSDNDQRDRGEPVVFPKGPTPRDIQVGAFESISNFLDAGLSGIVCAYTGFGKTVLGYHAAYRLQVKTLVITTKEDIYDQWIEGAQKFLGLSMDEIGEIRGDKCEVIGTKFCVAMIHSLSKDGKYPDWIGKGFGLVIYDECHRVPAEQFSSVAFMFPAMWRLGLTATLERSDGKELIVYAHIGPVRYKTAAEEEVPKVLLFKSQWECPRVIREDRITGEKKVVRLPHQPGKTKHIEKILAVDDKRNLMLSELVLQAFEKDRQIVIFSTLLDHLRTLHTLCRTKMGIASRRMGFYESVKTKTEKLAREAVKFKPIIFTTYGMMSEGTSINTLDTCLLGMPMAKVAQPVGRIRRREEGKKSPVVMDVQDLDSPVFDSYANSRLRWYQSIGCEIKRIQ